MGTPSALVTFLSFASFIVQILGLPTGAPSTACVSMYPQHPGPNGPVSAQTGLTVPFQIQVAPAQAGGSGYKITVLRNPNFPGSPPPLLGFFIQVRDPNGGDQPLGEFVNLPVYARYGDCGSTNTITHNNNMPKALIDGPGLEFFWNPTNIPASIRNLQVLGTFVQNMQTFWVKVPSQIFSLSTDETAPTASNANVPSVAVDISQPVSTEVPMSVNTNNFNNNVDTSSTNNDRRPGFGNNAQAAVTVPAPVAVPADTIHLAHGNGLSKIFPGLLSVFTGLLLAVL